MPTNHDLIIHISYILMCDLVINIQQCISDLEIPLWELHQRGHKWHSIQIQLSIWICTYKIWVNIGSATDFVPDDTDHYLNQFWLITKMFHGIYKTVISQDVFMNTVNKMSSETSWLTFPLYPTGTTELIGLGESHNKCNHEVLGQSDDFFLQTKDIHYTVRDILFTI